MSFAETTTASERVVLVDHCQPPSARIASARTTGLLARFGVARSMRSAFTEPGRGGTWT
jgi:hypothetical protein